MRRTVITAASLVMILSTLAVSASASTSADTFRQSCGGNRGFKVCVSYNYTTGYVATNVFNNASSGNWVSATLFLDVDNRPKREETARFYGQTWWGIGSGHRRPTQVCGVLHNSDGSWVLASHCSTNW